MRTIKDLGRDCSGATALVFGLGLFVFFGIAGLSVDFALSEHKRSELQQALDAAVLAGASMKVQGDEHNPLEKAHLVFASKGIATLKPAAFVSDSGIIRGEATSRIETGLSKLLLNEDMIVTVRSAATSAAVREPACIMAMHPHRKHTLEMKGSVSLIAPDCHIYGNSDDANDVVDPHDPGNFMTGKSVQAMGYGHNYIQNVTPPLEYAPEQLSDPLASMSIPAAGACDYNKMIVSATTATLDPGSYCGGLSVKSGANVTLNPGLYVISGGDLAVDQSTLAGDGVTIVLADTRATLDWSDATINLRAPAAGSDAGIAIKGLRQPGVHAFTNSAIDIYGVVYLPNGEVAWTNTGTPPATAKWTVWIVDGFLWEGDGVIRVNFDIENADIPYPLALRQVVPRGGEVRLVNESGH